MKDLGEGKGKILLHPLLKSRTRSPREYGRRASRGSSTGRKKEKGGGEVGGLEIF